MKRIALFGCGGFAKNHIKELNKYNDVEISYLIDPSRINQDGLVAMLNEAGKPKPKLFSSLADFSRSKQDYDAGIVVSPPETHFTITLALLRDNKPIYVEKPFTATSMEAKILNEIAKASNLDIMIGANRTVFAAYRTAAISIRDGEIGDVKAVSIFYRHMWDKNTKGNWRQDPMKISSGILADHSPHYSHFLFDDLRFVPEKVRHLGSRYNESGVDVDVSYIMFDKKDIPAIVVMDGSPSDNIRNEEIKIYGSIGNILIRFEEGGGSNAYIQSDGAEKRIDTAKAVYEIQGLGIPDYTSHPALIHNFISLLNGDTVQNANPGKNGILPVYLTELVQQSRNGRVLHKDDIDDLSRIIKDGRWFQDDSLAKYNINGRELMINKMIF